MATWCSTSWAPVPSWCRSCAATPATAWRATAGCPRSPTPAAGTWPTNSTPSSRPTAGCGWPATDQAAWATAWPGSSTSRSATGRAPPTVSGAAGKGHRRERTGYRTGMAESVLIVDDDPVVRRMLQLSFESEGFDVSTAGDGLEGLEAMRSGKPDVVILDIMMPKLHRMRVMNEVNGDDNLRGTP